MRTDGGAGRPRGDLVALLESMASVPVFARDRHLTVIAANARARALSGALRPGSNLLRWAFLGDDRPDCALATDLPAVLVAQLRDSLEQHDEDPAFRALVGELAAHDATFSRIWAAPGRTPPHEGIVGWSPTGAVIRFRELRLVDDHEVVVVVLYEAD
jgi:hypothetical protein